MWKSQLSIYLHEWTKRTTYWVVLCRYLSDTSFLIVIVLLLLYRTSGCFTSNGLTIVDILPSPPSDLTPLQTSTHSKGILIPSSFPVHPPALSYNSDSEFLRSVSESDSASDCGSDVVSEPGTQVCAPCKWNLFSKLLLQIGRSLFWCHKLPCWAERSWLLEKCNNYKKV